MKSFEQGFLESQPITQNLLRTVRLLGEFKGKQDLYRAQVPQVLETLRQAAIIQSTESSNRIEGVTAPAERIRDLVAQKTTPRNRSEQEIAGYRDVLNNIHANHPNIPFTVGIVLQFHRDLYRYSETTGGKWKPVDNEITETRGDGTKILRFRPLSAAATPGAMESLHQRFSAFWNAGEVEKLLLIATYSFDFLCIHPFLDGNGRMVRLLTLLLLYHADYEVGRYISLEKLIEDSKESYYDSLLASSQGWHEGKHQLSSWTEYLLGVLIAAYREFEKRVGILTTARGAKTQMVLDAIRNAQREFSVSDLKEQCPGVGIDLIRRVLARERAQGRISAGGRGRGAHWRKK